MTPCIKHGRVRVRVRARAMLIIPPSESLCMDKESDIRWLNETVRRAESGDMAAMEALDGLSGRRIEEIGAPALDRLAEEGGSWALLLMGRALYERAQSERDSEVATRLYEDSADMGNPYAMAALAGILEKGGCRRKSLREAYSLYRRAASLGCPPAERWMEENEDKGRCQADLDARLDASDPEAMREAGTIFEAGE